MRDTRIKMDGMMRTADALAAAHLGADAIGLVFCQRASRNISLEQAKEILSALPPLVTPLGVFVDEDTSRVRNVAEELGLRTVQLHGHETPQQVADLRPLTVIKSIKVQSPEQLLADLQTWQAAIAELGLSNLRGLVLESGGAHLGGSGKENDWTAIAAVHATGIFAGLPSLILAGGLTPQNVADVVRRFDPWAVDVSSGIESSPGQKSKEKMAQFVRAVRACCS